MHRHVIAHGHNFAVTVKDSTGIVTSFFDVGRKSGAAQGRAHLFRNGVEKALKNLQLDRITHGTLV